MRPLLLCGIAACFALRAANPGDLDFTLRLTRDPPVFHSGEPVEFEITYSTTKSGKYRGSWTNPSPELEVVTLHLSPTAGLVDLRTLHEGGFAGSILSGIGDLDPRHPVAQKADLADWYRFATPGHYQLQVTSPTSISRIKSAEEGGGLESMVLESNTVEFDILPRDSSWEAQEFNAAVQDLDAGPQAHADAIHRLVRLDTPASIQKLGSLYLANNDIDAGWVYRGLEESAHPEVAVPLLEAVLEDPQKRPPANLVDLLATLQVRLNKSQRREDYIAQDTARLVASIRQRPEPGRSHALYEAWQLAERFPNGLQAELRKQVLASAAELPMMDALGFVTQTWNQKSVPREQLLPLVRRLALALDQAPSDAAPFLQVEIFSLWCEESPRECGDAILAEAAQPDPPVLPQTILLLKESEHPELDELLKQGLSKMAQMEFKQLQVTRALLMRAGSRNLQPAVKEALAAGRPNDCETQSYLANYLFRFAPKDAAQFLHAAFARPDTSFDWLGFLVHQRYSDDLIPIAFDALNSPNPTTAAGAALFLGAHGPPDAEDVLWRRIDALWEHWRERAAELKSAAPLLSGPWPWAHFEQALANALVRGANWKLTSAEEERLRAGCLTDDCRKVAAGEMSLDQ